MKRVSHALHIVDVFAERPLAGNPLAVVVLDGDEPAQTWMLAVAAEMNLSETTFVQRRPVDGGWRMRMFTPTHEVAFAGHPILGSAWVVRHHLAAAPPDSVCIEVPVGPIAVRFDPDGCAWLRAPAIEPGRRCARAAMAAALGLSDTDIDDDPQQFHAGVSATLVPVRSLDALARCRLDLAAFAPLARDGFAPLVYAFCAQARRPGNDFSARFFFESNGVREDPATGNAGAFLGRWLLQRRGADALALRIEQGDAVGRVSLVRLRARTQAQASHEIDVGGLVFETVRGQLMC
jgi:trans-2,3-dihydro-3-hydroxyanthranilate isomerase